MDDRPMIVFTFACEMGLGLTLEACEAIAEKLAGEPITPEAVRRAVGGMGFWERVWARVGGVLCLLGLHDFPSSGWGIEREGRIVWVNECTRCPKERRYA